MDDNARTGELRRKLDKDPGSRLFAQLAEELRKDGKLDEAISVARKGLEKNPNYPSARLTLARALLDSGLPREARPELEQIVKASPDNIMASRLLGEALEGLGELAQAMQQFEKTLLVSPGDKAVLERITLLKGKLAPSSPPAGAASTPVSSAPAAQTEPAVPTPLPSVFAPETAARSPLPSVFDAPAAVSALPSVFDAPAAASPLPSVFAPVPALAAPPPASPAPAASGSASVALDRDLASGTFSPGSLSVTDVQKHFVEAAPPDTVGFGEMQATLPPLAAPASELPSVEMPPENPDVGARTLPLSSVTLADLYLQQGLKAEASAVLSQVIRDEPENREAKSKFAAVSSDLASAAAPAVVVPTAPAGAPVRAPRTRAEVRDRALASLKVFASAVEREAVSQRATERGAY